MSNTKTALFTANEDVAASFLNVIRESQGWELLHLSLENYSYAIDMDEEEMISEQMNSFSYIIHGNLRNARFFIQWATEMSTLEEIRNIVHLVPNQTTVDFLDRYNIPAVMPREDARAIDIIEFLLRITREGTILYPTTDAKDEEVPGLLKELEMPVIEFQVCKEDSLESKMLEDYRQKAYSADVDTVIFHSRSSVTRIKAAFPDLDFNALECISSGQAVTEKLLESNISPALEARGSWRSLLSILRD